MARRGLCWDKCRRHSGERRGGGVYRQRLGRPSPCGGLDSVALPKPTTRDTVPTIGMVALAGSMGASAKFLMTMPGESVMARTVAPSVHPAGQLDAGTPGSRRTSVFATDIDRTAPEIGRHGALHDGAAARADARGLLRRVSEVDEQSYRANGRWRKTVRPAAVSSCNPLVIEVSG